ncbi:hypothetical protein, partial [Microcoleus sp. herbarium12]|uniref:hypothetical protein n=1 Tax=Microcoleus sp. herbarium12 TaxID=3055437 RepID=UPI002FD1DFAD
TLIYHLTAQRQLTKNLNTLCGRSHKYSRQSSCVQTTACLTKTAGDNQVGDRLINTDKVMSRLISRLISAIAQNGQSQSSVTTRRKFQ